MNHLQNETSPYLLQHVNNPVDWHPWSEEVFKQAKEENKLVIVSIGYSTCHWCHVMAHETFEDDSAAAYMNEHFINIKVDREERPDIDQIYMSAVQLMTGQGGWPLNVVTLPDGRPIWGGTYFKKDQWLGSLEKLLEVYQEQPEQVEDYATRLAEGIRASELFLPVDEKYPINQDDVDMLIKHWRSLWDTARGGNNRAPKFPMPNNILFTLEYGQAMDHPEVLQYAKTTLEAIQNGGIYDHLGGGFARYATDADWKVPHFEKMLYDNAQMLSVLAKGYAQWHDESYLHTIRQTISWLKREMKSKDGLYFSAIDADSEGVEGKFYTWTKEELQAALGNRFEEFTTLMPLEPAFWEGQHYVIHRRESFAETATRLGITEEICLQKWEELCGILNAKREGRIRPGVDEKTLCSWNALLAIGLFDVAQNTPITEAKDLGLDLLKQMKKHFIVDGQLMHTYKDGQAKIPAYLDDYTSYALATLKSQPFTGDAGVLEEVEALTAVIATKFSLDETPFFAYVQPDGKHLITPTTEVYDQVIPSSNAMMAELLFVMGRITGRSEWEERSAECVMNIADQAVRNGGGHSKWAQVMLRMVTGFKEVVICGDDALQTVHAFNGKLPFNAVLLSSTSEASGIFEGRNSSGKTLIYVCENRSCQLPTGESEEAIKQLSK